MAKNAGDEASVRAQEKIQKKAEDEENQDIKWCLAQPAARRLLRMVIFDMCNYETIAFTGNNRTFFNEGVISVGILLAKRLKGVDSAALFHIENSVKREND